MDGSDTSTASCLTRAVNEGLAVERPMKYNAVHTMLRTTWLGNCIFASESLTGRFIENVRKGGVVGVMGVFNGNVYISLLGRKGCFISVNIV